MPIIEGGGATPGAGVLPGSRRARISDYVAAAGEASVIELAASFGVSADTVRRDLVRLEQGGLLARTHGGAVALRTPAAELAPLALAHNKLVLNSSPADDAAIEASFAAVWASEDVREAAAARDEKRSPQFRGR